MRRLCNVACGICLAVDDRVEALPAAHVSTRHKRPPLARQLPYPFERECHTVRRPQAAARSSGSTCSRCGHARRRLPLQSHRLPRLPRLGYPMGCGYTSPPPLAFLDSGPRYVRLCIALTSLYVHATPSQPGLWQCSEQSSCDASRRPHTGGTDDGRHHLLLNSGGPARWNDLLRPYIWLASRNPGCHDEKKRLVPEPHTVLATATSDAGA